MSDARLYVCDGEVPGCKKQFCKYLERGDCSHTADRDHARYPLPREWDRLEDGTYYEKERA